MIERPRRARLLQLVCRRCRVRLHAAPMPGLSAGTDGIQLSTNSAIISASSRRCTGSKFLKRQMYGRAGLDLLRVWVLHPN